ncbi:MFS transporter [Geodermatophilus sp. DF01_2]|uniref:MFS transporter n=1 Tax=Geodermatophilus sp. DF01-2 TaxID=2559610 RepID=UPI0014301116|nr:MFS transporter [Geodermatophilus sp. DF01_2]
MAGPSRAGHGVSGAAPGALDILRIRPFLVLWISAAVVFLGVMAQNIARTWLAFELTGSNAALGGVLLSFGVAMLVATPWGGVAADRLPKRLVMQVATLLLVLSSAWIGIATATGVVAYWMLIVAGIVQAVGFALFSPARMALLAELVPRNAVSGAVSLILVNSEVSRVVGPALAGVVIGSLTFGTEAVFLISAVLLGLGMVINIALPPGHRQSASSDRSPWGELVDGVSYVGGRRDLSALVWCGVGVTMAGLPYLAFLPAVASDLFDLGPAGYGLLSASSAVGAVITGLALGRRSHRGNQRRVLIGAGALFGLALAAMAAAPTFILAVVALLVVGGALLAFQTTSQALLLALSDIEFHGRVQGLVMLSFGAFGVAALPLGVLADAIGPRWTLAGMGVVVVGIVLVFAVVSRRTRAASRLLDLG